MMAAYYPNNLTTDHIQQYLDENKSLILKIVESQNSGKHAECAENQARLQRNLMYLAAIADSQPPPLTMHSQYGTAAGGGMVQQQHQAGAHYLQQQQGPSQHAQQMVATQSLMAARSSAMYGQQPMSALQQQAALYGQLGMSSGGGIQILQSEAAATHGFGDFGLGSSGFKQEMHGSGEGGRAAGSSGGGVTDGGDTLYLRSAGGNQ